MTHMRPADPLTGEALNAALAKTIGIFGLVFALMTLMVVPAMLDRGADAATIASIVLQLGLTTLCVGGWFVLFLAFDRHLGEVDDH